MSISSFKERTEAKILIAEDSPTQAAELSFLLEENGYTVEIAPNGLVAIEAARRFAPDLIISDIVMPQVDGYEFCRRIKADSNLKETPFILVTSLSNPQDVFKGLDVGADNFIVKPFNESNLLSRVRYLLTNRILRKAGKLQLGIEIELAGQRHFITAERQQILDLLISTYEQAVSLYDSLDARQRELSRSYETLNALYGVADGLNRGKTLTDLATSAIEGGLRLPGVKAAWVYLLDGDEFRLLAAQGAPEGMFELDEQCRECKCQRSMREGTFAAGASMIDCERLRRVENADGLRYHATVPLIVDGTPIGIFNLVGAEMGMFSADEMRTLSGIGNQIAIGLERVQLHRQLERTVEKRTAQLKAEIVERQAAEQAAHQAGERLRQILQSLPIPTTTVDLDGNVLIWNRAAEEIFGYASEDVLGKASPLRLDGEDPLADALAQHRSLKGLETQRRHQDGTMIDVRVTTGPLLDDDASIKGHVVSLEDMRERRKIEGLLRQSQKMEAIGNLTGGIAHDFNNLLTIVIGNIDLAAHIARENPAIAELLEGALTACLRGADLTKHLLAFGRRQPLKPEIVNVNKLVGGMVKLLSRTLGENVTIELVARPEIWPVDIDPAQLDSAIVNLAVNARDAMPGGGKLVIETKNVTVEDAGLGDGIALKPGDYVRVSVSDTGQGIPAAVLTRIFEPFFTTKSPGKGTGLGLAMVYGFVRQSGGDITVYSEVGAGTVFNLYLPRATAMAAPAAIMRKKRDTSANRIGKTVLVVEDNPGVRKIAERNIRQLRFEVIIAESGEEALAVIESGAPIDLVFSDVVMPGSVNGIQLVERLALLRPGLPVLLASGFPESALNASNPEIRVKILNKPYRIDDLETAIDEFFGD